MHLLFHGLTGLETFMNFTNGISMSPLGTSTCFYPYAQRGFFLSTKREQVIYKGFIHGCILAKKALPEVTPRHTQKLFI